MPENVPKAVMVLIWLLSGVIVLGYLIMAHTLTAAAAFAALFYGIPLLWQMKRTRGTETPS
jgi:hypothetical protein